MFLCFSDETQTHVRDEHAEGMNYFFSSVHFDMILLMLFQNYLMHTSKDGIFGLDYFIYASSNRIFSLDIYDIWITTPSVNVQYDVTEVILVREAFMKFKSYPLPSRHLPAQS